MATRRSGRPASGSTASRPERAAGAGRGDRRGRGDARPDGAGRAAGVDRAGPARCTPTSAAPTHTTQVVPGGTVTERWVPVDRVGLYVPGGLAMYPSTVVMNVVPGPGGRGRARWWWPARRSRTTAACPTPGCWPPARCSASTRCTPSAAPRRSRCWRTAPRCDAGGRPALRAGRHDHRAGQHLGHRGQAAAARRGRHRRRGRPDRDRHPGRRHRRPGARRRRPDQPGRARPAGRQRAGHRRRRRWPTRSSAELARQVPATKHAERVAHRADRRAVRRRAGRRPRARAAGGRRVRGRAPGDPDRATRGEWAHAGPQRRRDLRGRLVAGVARRLLRRLQPRAAHRRLRPALLRAVRAVVPARHPRRRVRRGRAARRRAARGALANVEDLPAHGQAVTARFPGGDA